MRVKPEIICKAMLLRILMDVGDKVKQVSLVFDCFSFKPALEQTSCEVVCLIDSFSIRVKEIGELLRAEIGQIQFGVFGNHPFMYNDLLPNSDQHMKMIFHQAVRKSFSDGLYMFIPKVKKVGIVLFLKKDVASTVSPIVDMVKYT
jgi:hypothetical protein